MISFRIFSFIFEKLINFICHSNINRSIQDLSRVNLVLRITSFRIIHTFQYIFDYNIRQYSQCNSIQDTLSLSSISLIYMILFHQNKLGSKFIISLISSFRYLLVVYFWGSYISFHLSNLCLILSLFL